MKKVIIFLFLFFIADFVFSQDNCNDRLKTEEDKFDRSVIISTNPIAIKRDGKDVGAFQAVYYKQSKATALIFIINNNGCIDDKALVTFLFDDGKKQSEFSVNKFNCDGTFSILIFDKKFKKGKTVLNMLLDDLLTAARFKFRRGYKDIEFTKEESNSIKDLLKCLTKNVS